MRLVVPALVAVVGLMGVVQVRADEPAQAEKQSENLPTVQDKASYGIGYQIGRQLRGNGMLVTIPAFLRGLQDALAGKPTALPQRDMIEAIGTHQRDSLTRLAHENKEKGDAFLKANAQKPGVVQLPSGLQYQVLKQGDGPRPKLTDRVKTHYHGTLIDGTVFDSSVEAGEPVTFAVNEVIPGWTEALQLMRVGDKWRLFIPPNLAYGVQGAPPDIAPNSVLIFEVELLGIE
ncbi:MAG: peptidyl-prolyl cis-trans isomerase [Pirellulaceae bacterium]|nr:MAG: peptidyl-prolyl cis-trans isomerase [Pirellulaceae bacterium]